MPGVSRHQPHRVRDFRGRRPGYVVARRAVPADFVVERDGLRCTAPALTALDLIDYFGGEAIDVPLRSRQATLQHNLRVVVRGHPYYVDIGFPEINLAVEIDGREFHTASADFEKDRWRQNDLVNAGWRVLRFPARMLEETPQLVLAVIAEALTG